MAEKHLGEIIVLALLADNGSLCSQNPSGHHGDLLSTPRALVFPGRVIGGEIVPQRRPKTLQIELDQ